MSAHARIHRAKQAIRRYLVGDFLKRKRLPGACNTEEPRTPGEMPERPQRERYSTARGNQGPRERPSPREASRRPLAALVEGNSECAVERLCDVNRKTISRLAIEFGTGAQRLHDRMARDLACTQIVADECWTYCMVKEARVRPDHPEGSGESYVFVDKTSRFAITWHIGKRNQADTDAFVADLRARLTVMPTIVTDGFAAYPSAVGAEFGLAVDFAQTVKNHPSGRRDDDHRYEPPRGIDFITKKTVFGAPDSGQRVDCLHRAPERHHAAPHRTHEKARVRLLQAAPEPRRGVRDQLRLVQRGAHPAHYADDSRDGRRGNGPTSGRWTSFSTPSPRRRRSRKPSPSRVLCSLTAHLRASPANFRLAGASCGCCLAVTPRRVLGIASAPGPRPPVAPAATAPALQEAPRSWEQLDLFGHHPDGRKNEKGPE